MRARRRRSVLNTVSAAALEVAIMGIFVIIAQPQLRDALFEILQVDPAHHPVQAAAQPVARQDSPAGSPASLDRAVQAVMSSPVGQAVENSLAKWSIHQADLNTPTRSVQLSTQLPSTQLPSTQLPSTQLPSTQLPSTQLPSHPITAPQLLLPTSSLSADTTNRNQPVQNHLTGYSPYEQFESIRVSVPQPNSQPQIAQQPVVQQRNGLFGNGAFSNQYPHNNPGISTNAPQHAIPQYVAPQSYARHQSYGAQQPTPTQLTANQWNIASAGQTQYPNANGQPNGNGWIPAHATETSFRQLAPPPYGTQSMWK